MSAAKDDAAAAAPAEAGPSRVSVRLACLEAAVRTFLPGTPSATVRQTAQEYEDWVLGGQAAGAPD